MKEKILKYGIRYAIITLSITIMSIGVYFFKFPNNFVFGGVTGMAALAAKLTPLSASAFSSAANLILLGIGFLFLGREFAFNTGYATLLMSLEPMVLEKVAPLFGPLCDQLQDFIRQQHLNAFISMLSTTEVFGKGFSHT